MKNKIACALIAGAMLVGTTPAFAAEPTPASNNFSSTTFSQPHAATATEFAENKVQTAKVQEVQKGKGYEVTLKKPQDPIYSLTSPNWSYTGLFPGAYIDTNATYTLSSTQQVVVKAVQYPDGILYGGRVAVAAYQLVAQNGSGMTTNKYKVTGNYDSTAVQFSFFDVAKGTYKLRIWNDNTNIDTRCDIAGNGFVYYY